MSASDNDTLWIIILITSCDKYYYDEANIEVGKPIDCKVVMNRHVELTEEEKAEARRQAIKRAEAYAKMKQQREKATAKRTETIQQPSLFDF